MTDTKNTVNDELEALLDEFAADVEGLAMLEYMAGSAPSREQVEQAKADTSVTRQRIASAFQSLRASIPGGVGVKGLEWQQSSEGYADGQWFSLSMFGEYHAYMHKPSGRAWLKGPGLEGFHDDINAAKAAAQADYEQRILSAIDLSPEEELETSIEGIPDPNDVRRWNSDEEAAAYTRLAVSQGLYATPPQPVVTDEMVARFMVSFWGDSRQFVDEGAVQSALTAALSVKPQSGSDKP